jgi:DNA-binding MarR family transcriptional regulator
MENEGTGEEIAIPALLRHARGSFSRSIRKELRAADCEDLPRNGPYILGGMANHDATPSQLLREIGISDRAAGQLLDTLVLRGYLARQPDPEDGRKVTVELTERGRAAALAVGEGIDNVDALIAERLSPEELRGLRRGLVELIAIKEEFELAEAIDPGLPGRTGGPG